jgi:predicted nucleic acid-binding protein
MSLLTYARSSNQRLSQRSIIASDLTLIECDRVLIRAAALGDIPEADAADRRAHLVAIAAHWQIMRVAGEVMERARQPFPAGPIHTLDAIHLAAAITARAAIAGLAFLSLNERIRASGRKLGLEVLPA